MVNKESSKKSLGSFLRSLYYYFFTALGLILVIIGLFQLSDYTVKRIFFQKYNLGYEENRCDYERPKIAPVEGKTLTPEEIESDKKAKEECLQKLEEFRKFKEVTDVARAVTMVVIGGIVFVFHYRRTKHVV